MGLFRLVYRLFKAAVIVYGIWRAFRDSRWLAVVGAIWAIVRRTPRQNSRQKARLVFVSAMEPAIYQRKGWRKLALRRTPI